MKQWFERYRSLIVSIAIAVVVCLAVPSALPALSEAAQGMLALGGATLAGEPISSLFLSFLVYGFIGWFYESTFCAMANQGHFANSGFLLGPCCPIYGVGALVCWLLLRNIENTFVLFVLAAVVCSVIEYTVGVVLEKTTHAKFWDYSDKPFNINGRVCLYGAVLFGAGCVLVCRVIEPALLYAFGCAPDGVVLGVALVLLVVLIADFVTSLASWRRLSSTLEAARSDMAEHVNDSLSSLSDKMLDKVPEQAVEGAAAIQEGAHGFNERVIAATDSAADAVREKAEAAGEAAGAAVDSVQEKVSDAAAAAGAAVDTIQEKVAGAAGSAGEAAGAAVDAVQEKVSGAVEAVGAAAGAAAGSATDAVRGKLAEAGEAAGASAGQLREKVKVSVEKLQTPRFKAERARKPHGARFSIKGRSGGKSGLRSARWADREARKPEPPKFVVAGAEKLELVGERIKLTLGKRDVRFFNAFPNLRMERYEDTIRETGLKERVRELFGKKGGEPAAGAGGDGCASPSVGSEDAGSSASSSDFEGSGGTED